MRKKILRMAISGPARGPVSSRPASADARLPARPATSRPPSAETLHFLRPAHRHPQILHQAVAERIDPAMDMKRLAAAPGLLHEDVGGDIAHLADDVELAEPVEAGAALGQRRQLVAMLVADLADGMEPVIDQAAALAVHRRTHPAA